MSTESALGNCLISPRGCPFGHGSHRSPEATAHSLRETIEHGTYTALLAAAGFIIVNLLKVAERREDREEHPHH